MKHDWQSVPIPKGLAQRPRDPRGFPITFVTLMQSDGRPDFTTIDGQKILRCIREGLCGLCGLGWPGPGPYLGRRDHLMAFIGGPLSIQHGNFLDPPMHVECAEYAMQVCPHIAIPTARYGKPKEGEGRELYPHVSSERPDRFGLLVARGCSIQAVDGQPAFFVSPDRIDSIIWQDEKEASP